MIYNLLAPYIHTSHIANLFHYITFRMGLAILFSIVVSFVIGPRVIRFLQNLQKYGQPIRNDIPEAHQLKVGTPTMGGIMIILSVCSSTLLFTDLTNKYIWVVLFVFISFGIVGFLDDYAKITKNHYRGISGKKRLLLQLIIGLTACLILNSFNSPNNNILSIPFFKNLIIDLGMLYIPFLMFVVVGAANAVNLTDGLDGLAIVPIAITAASFALIIYLVGNSFYANYLQIIYVPHISELAIFCMAIVGASLGFLWFNAQPAQIFMGDIGSLSLGGALGIISVITKHEIVLAIIGGLFVVETVSVIIQVYYFRTTGGKRFFRMAPLHHHFEKAGWPESKVVIRFWIIAIIFALIGLASLKLR